MNYFCQQDAACKCHPASLYPGAWLGSLLHCGDVYPLNLVTQNKWDHFGDGLCWIPTYAMVGDEIDASELCWKNGLGINLMEVYTNVQCYF